MSDYITTYTGKRFIPKEPDADKIDIRDMIRGFTMDDERLKAWFETI